ncbi:MAG TPA: dienelactone hydrolase family protein [Myxococcota bacterium]|nr:dienelactone hydrolase family protein [Myxococcota bacterium]
MTSSAPAARARWLLSLAALGLLAAGCPRQPAEPAAYPLAFQVVYTAGAEPSQRLPMIVALHGLGDTPARFAALFAGFPEPARVVLPEAPRRARNGGRSWFGLRFGDGGAPGVREAQARQAAERVAALVERLSRELPTEGKPRLCGFSQGALLALLLAWVVPERWGRVVPVAGFLPEGLWPPGPAPAGQARPPIRALHGQADGVVPFAADLRTVERLRALGLDASLEAFPEVPHAIAPAVHARLYELLRRRPPPAADR